MTDTVVRVLDQRFLTDGVHCLLTPYTNAPRLPKCHFFPLLTFKMLETANKKKKSYTKADLKLS